MTFFTASKIAEVTTYLTKRAAMCMQQGSTMWTLDLTIILDGKLALIAEMVESPAMLFGDDTLGHWAIRCRDFGKLEMFCRVYGFDIFTKNRGGQTVLDLAHDDEVLPIIRLMTEHCSVNGMAFNKDDLVRQLLPPA